MDAATKRRPPPKPQGASNGSGVRVATKFPPGSVEAALSAIGKSATVREWEKVPADYFANLDHYRLGAPKKK